MKADKTKPKKRKKNKVQVERKTPVNKTPPKKASSAARNQYKKNTKNK